MTEISRRSFLVLATASAAAFAFPSGLLRAGEAPRVDRLRFPQSVASGDPRPDSIVLWTRVVAGDGSPALLLQVAGDDEFTDLRVERRFVVGADTDGCLKVRVEGLQPGQHYRYRFLLADGDGRWVSSPVGRTRTAPALEADQKLRFALLSCQDFNGRWYNSLLPLLDEDLDFILHVGDFIYETTGDPSFQSGEGRRVVFDDLAGALPLGAPEARYYAAASLDNYRQLYREYRSDPVLQALLERSPLIAIWDDHEFANDCWQDVGTASNGRRDERDPERRRNAEQAWCEFMPAAVVPGSEGRAVDRDALFPALSIWREFVFGRRMALFATDFRSARPDHLVPEDAFPGAIVFDEPALRAALPVIDEDFDTWAPVLHPYVDLGERRFRRQRVALARALRRAYTAEGLDADEVERRLAAILAAPVAVPVLNAILASHNARAPFFLDARSIEDTAGLPCGLSWAMLGKSKLFAEIGSRYFVVAPTYRLLARLRAASTASPYGDAQAAWLRDSLERSSGQDWRFVASSVSFTSLVLDLRRPELQAPPAWAHEVLLNVDHWDGFPVERESWFDTFDSAGCVLLSGDLHASLASQHRAGVVEFTTAAVSSSALGSTLARNVEGDEATRAAGERLVEHFDALLMAGYTGLRHAQTRRNGVTVVEVGEDALDARFIEIDGALTAECLYHEPERLRAALRVVRFRVAREGRRLTLSEPAPGSDGP